MRPRLRNIRQSHLRKVAQIFKYAKKIGKMDVSHPSARLLPTQRNCCSTRTQNTVENKKLDAVVADILEEEAFLAVTTAKDQTEVKGRMKTLETRRKKSETGINTGPHVRTKPIRRKMRRSIETDGGRRLDTSLHREGSPFWKKRIRDKKGRGFSETDQSGQEGLKIYISLYK